MSCFTLSRVANTTYPISQLFKDLGNTLPSCLCKAESEAFQIVYLYKDSREPVKSTEGHSCFVKDTVTGEVYWNDPADIVRAKSAGLVLGIPLLTVGVILWNAKELIINIGIIALRALENCYNLATGKELCDSEISALRVILYERLLAIFTAPLYAVAMETAALFAACIKPYHGRKLVAMIEHAWRNGVSYTKDCGCEKTDEKPVFYLAWCFQVRGKITLAADGNCLESPLSLLKFPRTDVQRVKIGWVRQSSSNSTLESALISS